MALTSFYPLHGVARRVRAVWSIGLSLARRSHETGTPDILAGGSQGHTFVEVTTQAQGLTGKLAGDIRNCLDPEKSGVPVDKIARICLFFTGCLDAEEVEFSSCPRQAATRQPRPLHLCFRTPRVYLNGVH